VINLVWLFLLLAGIVVAAINGNIEVVTTAALESAQTAVTIALGLIGIMAFWLGILRIAQDAGLVDGLAKLVRPLMVFLFPSVSKDHPAMGAMVMNLSANIMGLGNAATPFGLKAMQELQKLNKNPKEASEAMCTFLALNTGAITLIPATIIGVRVAAESANPAEIVGPTIFATTCAMIVAITMDRILRYRYRKKHGG